ncbi:methyl-accepting chemotaxis protein [Natronospirillum operosum]|uniref:Methyl-accepting chemotaxis protein n=1 Tax=Natronospirillum operosum TaxID=2759953 RepID=A0A4Z0WGJ6_9GAMM|nr:methyl-accepting chemotaxis protein [Natronospirillum operosum]TGG95678.1 methyl-accepting chemotaxis protein [Natronospirillum operosum]
MMALLKPGVVLLNRLRYPQKFLLISLVILLPLLGVGFALQSEMADRVEFISQERQGVSDMELLANPLRLMQQHRGLSAAVIGGDESARPTLESIGREAEGALSQLNVLVAQSQGADGNIQRRIERLQADWHALMGQSTSLSGGESFARHTALIDDLFDIVRIVAERSNLIMDSMLTTHYMIDLVINQLPRLTESMGQARGLSGGVAAAGEHSDRSWLEIGIRQSQVQNQLTAFDYNITRIFESQPELEDRLGPLADRAHQSITRFNDLLVQEFSDPDHVQVSAGEIMAESTTAIDQVFEIFGQIVPILDDILAQRQAHAAMVRNMTIGTMGIVLLIITYLFSAFYRGVLGSIEYFQEATVKLADGDLTARIQINSRDELGDVGHALNRMVEGFERVVKHVMLSTEQVAQASEELSTVTEQTTSGVARQRSETEQVASAMSELVSTVREVANNTSQAAEAATGANSEAREGQAELEKMIALISALADALENAGTVISELQECSDEIGNVLGVISDIADQTNLLALNAAIEAARAGESGRGFAVVADEVRSLAGRTQNSTEEIQDTIERLQQGAGKAVSAIEHSRTQSTESVAMAGSTGRSLESILRQVTAISEMNVQVATATEQQSSVAEEINRNVTSISEVAEEAATASAQTAASSENLSRLAQELLESVSHFKVAS